MWQLRPRDIEHAGAAPSLLIKQAACTCLWCQFESVSPEREIKPLSRQASAEELDCKLLGEQKAYKDVSQTERTQASLRLDVT